jgi:type I restriction enzyme R subunit
VFDVDRKLLVMRPYQIVAAERILQRIATATNHKQLGTVAAGGYIWHTTGSGKTLTSFKAAQLARGLPNIDKVLFVVDRKDLDYQTMREYERFEKGAANSNTSTAVLQRQLEDPNARIIITTIQKLSRFVVKNKKHPVYEAHVVVIFDECHRSQFGDMHAEITRVFQRYHLFGFTGTPIFAENAGTGRQPAAAHHRAGLWRQAAHLHHRRCHQRQERAAVSHRLHQHDQDASVGIRDKQVSAIDTERALLAPERITQIVGYIREHFDQKTKRASSYRHDGKRLAGFNSLFACASIEAAKRYYTEFAEQQKDIPEAQRLKVGLIYSFAANEEESDGICSARRSLKPRAGCQLPRFSGCRDPGLQRSVRHQLRHQRRQVPELLQGLVAAPEKARAGPGNRGQHVPDRLRCHHAQHPVGGQEPEGARLDSGVFAHQPYPQFGQDLRQHRLLPRIWSRPPTTRSPCSATRTPRASCC